MNCVKYTAKLSLLSKIITTVVIVISICVFANLIYTGLGDNKTESILSIIILFVALIFSYLIHPKFYSVTQNEVVINRLLFSRKIKISTIEKIEKIEYPALGVRIKLCGSNGYWGYWGIYSSSKYGVIRMNASNLNGLIIIITKSDKKFLVSPEDLDHFLKMVTDQLSEQER